VGAEFVGSSKAAPPYQHAVVPGMCAACLPCHRLRIHGGMGTACRVDIGDAMRGPAQSTAEISSDSKRVLAVGPTRRGLCDFV
jgi:hypothetical protein